MNKGQFIELLTSIDPDPHFLALIINKCFERLPDATAWKLACQLYSKYYCTDSDFKITSNLSGESLYFASAFDCAAYLKKIGYSEANPRTIGEAFRNRSRSFCNHTFERTSKEKKEVIYYED